VRTPITSPDDRLLARLQAPPDLSEGIDALAYWTGRRRKLSWYRLRARREASRMTRTWEQRVRRALVSQRGAGIDVRMSAGLLVAGNVARRWLRRTAIAVTALVVAAVAAAPVVAVVTVLLHVL
jgi:hypothetical protein